MKTDTIGYVSEYDNFYRTTYRTGCYTVADHRLFGASSGGKITLNVRVRRFLDLADNF